MLQIHLVEHNIRIKRNEKKKNEAATVVVGNTKERSNNIYYDEICLEIQSDN